MERKDLITEAIKKGITPEQLETLIKFAVSLGQDFNNLYNSYDEVLKKHGI